MLLDDREGAYHPIITSILWLRDSGVGRSYILDKGEDTHAICDHGQGISLGHPLLAMEELTYPVAQPDQQCGPVAVAVKFKPHTTWPLVTHRPHHGYAFLLIKRIARVNEEKPPFLLLGVLMPQEPHYVNSSLHTGFQPPAELLHTTDLLGIRPCQLQHAL